MRVYVWLLGLSLSLLVSQATAQQRTVILEGVIYDAATEAPLRGATVGINDFTIGTSSTYEGAFQLRLPAGTASCVLQVQLSGYADWQDSIIVVGDTLRVSPKLHSGFSSRQRSAALDVAPTHLEELPYSVLTLDSMAWMYTAFPDWRTRLEGQGTVYMEEAPTLGVGGTLLLYDGLKYQNPYTRAPLWDLLPTSFVGSVQLTQNPMSVVQGAGGIGGAFILEKEEGRGSYLETETYLGVEDPLLELDNLPQDILRLPGRAGMRFARVWDDTARGRVQLSGQLDYTNYPTAANRRQRVRGGQLYVHAENKKGLGVHVHFAGSQTHEALDTILPLSALAPQDTPVVSPLGMIQFAPYWKHQGPKLSGQLLWQNTYLDTQEKGLFSTRLAYRLRADLGKDWSLQTGTEWLASNYTDFEEELVDDAEGSVFVRLQKNIGTRLRLFGGTRWSYRVRPALDSSGALADAYDVGANLRLSRSLWWRVGAQKGYDWSPLQDTVTQQWRVETGLKKSFRSTGGWAYIDISAFYTHFKGHTNRYKYTPSEVAYIGVQLWAQQKQHTALGDLFWSAQYQLMFQGDAEQAGFGDVLDVFSVTETPRSTRGRHPLHQLSVQVQWRRAAWVFGVQGKYRSGLNLPVYDALGGVETTLGYMPLQVWHINVGRYIRQKTYIGLQVRNVFDATYDTYGQQQVYRAARRRIGIQVKHHFAAPRYL